MPGEPNSLYAYILHLIDIGPGVPGEPNSLCAYILHLIDIGPGVPGEKKERQLNCLFIMLFYSLRNF